MRLSVSLDPDLDPVVRALARDRNISVSAALNQLLRRALAPKPVPANAALPDDGLPIAHGRRVFTSEDVYRLENETS